MSIAGRILIYLVNKMQDEVKCGSAISVFPTYQLATLQLANRKGSIHAVHGLHSSYVCAYNTKHSLTSKQINSFNSMSYKVVDIAEFVACPEKLVTHLIMTKMKTGLRDKYKFAAIDGCGKVYAYACMPSYYHDLKRWSGYSRTFICRLEPDEYRGFLNTVFSVNGWIVKPLDTNPVSDVKAPGVALTETLTHHVDINDAIRKRIEYMNQKSIEISKLTSQILDLQNDIEEIKKDLANVNIEKVTLIKAAQIMGIYEGENA